MKYLLLSIVMFLISNNLAAQTENISNIKIITQEAFNNLQTPENGDICLIKETETLMYYINNKWYALQGECTPRPSSPKIDSVKTTEDALIVYFTPISQKLQYEIQILDTDIATTVSKSPAKLPMPSKKTAYIIQLQGISNCGKAGPMVTVVNLQ